MEVFTTAPSLIVRGSKPREGRAGNVVGVAGHADPCDGDEDGDNEKFSMRMVIIMLAVSAS